MVVASKVLLQKVGDLLLDVDGCTISPSTEVRNLGVILDSTLSFQSHIKSITKSAFYHLKNISRLRPSLSEPVAETLIHAFITSRLDYCNGVLSRLPSKTLDRLQYAARVLNHTKPWQHITPTLIRLHWLPVKSRINYKILLLTYRSIPFPRPPISVWPPPPLYTVSGTALIKHTSALYRSPQTTNPRWQSLVCDSSHSLEHSPSWNPQSDFSEDFQKRLKKTSF